MEKQKILFVAGDGASGRIAVEAEEALRQQGVEVHAITLVQEGGGAEKLCRAESRMCAVSTPEDFTLEQFADISAVVTGISGTAFQLELAVIQAAFLEDMPVICVFDHPLSLYHPHVAEMVNMWKERQRPPFFMTALTRRHAEEIARVFPDLKDCIRCIGNPLHAPFERLREREEETQEINDRLSEADPHRSGVRTIAVFLVGDGYGLVECLAMVDALAGAAWERRISQPDCASGVRILYDVHATVHNALLPRVEAHAWRWTRQPDPAAEISMNNMGCLLAGVRSEIQPLPPTQLIKPGYVSAVTGMPQDEMILAADVVVADISSTVVERAFLCRKSVVCPYGPRAKKALRQMGLQVRTNAAALVPGAATLMERPGQAYEILDALENKRLQEARGVIAEQSGLLSHPGAMKRLVDLIQRTLR